MSKHKNLADFIKFQESRAFHVANSHIGHALSPRNNKHNAPYSYDDPHFDAFSYFVTNEKGELNPIKNEHGSVLRSYNNFVKLYPDVKGEEFNKLFNDYEYEIHRAIYNEDFDLLGTDNPDIIESYEIIKHFRYDEIASTGLALYNHLVKEDDNWRANRKQRYNNRLIYLSNEKTGSMTGGTIV